MPLRLRAVGEALDGTGPELGTATTTSLVEGSQSERSVAGMAAGTGKEEGVGGLGEWP